MRSRADHIRSLLADGPATSGEIAAELGLAVNLTSAHLNSLVKYGFVKRETFPTGNRRRKFMYSLGPRDLTPH